MDKKKGTKTHPGQPDWERFWRNTMAPFRSSRIGKKAWRLLQKYNSRKCLKLLGGEAKIRNILELGGGSGCLIGIISRKLGLKSEALTLIDKSPEARRVWEQLSGFGRYIQDDFFAYDFGGQRFDLVFSDGLIEHWADREKRLRVIKKHGELSRRYVMIRVPRKGLIMDLFGMREKEGYEKHYSPDEFKQEVLDARLKLLGFEGSHSFLTALAEVD